MIFASFFVGYGLSCPVLDALTKSARDGTNPVRSRPLDLPSKPQEPVPCASQSGVPGGVELPRKRFLNSLIRRHFIEVEETPRNWPDGTEGSLRSERLTLLAPRAK